MPWYGSGDASMASLSQSIQVPTQLCVISIFGSGFYFVQRERTYCNFSKQLLGTIQFVFFGLADAAGPMRNIATIFVDAL